MLSALSGWRTPRIRDASNVYTPCATPTTSWPEVIAVVVVFYCVYLAAKWHFIYLTRKNLLLFLRETLANIFRVQTAAVPTPTPVDGQDNPHTHTLVSLSIYIYIWYIGVINTAVKFTSTPNFHQLSLGLRRFTARSSLGAFVCCVSINVNYSACTVRTGKGVARGERQRSKASAKPSLIWPWAGRGWCGAMNERKSYCCLLWDTLKF